MKYLVLMFLIWEFPIIKIFLLSLVPSSCMESFKSANTEKQLDVGKLIGVVCTLWDPGCFFYTTSNVSKYLPVLINEYNFYHECWHRLNEPLFHSSYLLPTLFTQTTKRSKEKVHANILKNRYKKVRKNVGIGWID